MTTGMTRRAIAAAAMSLIAISNAKAAVTIPGVFEAEAFNTGGEGVGYHDKTAGNQGDAKFRTSEGVDIFVSNDPSGGVYIVKNFEAGEWLAYTMRVSAGGNYDFELRAATDPGFPDSAFHLEVDGTNATGSVVLPNTGGWTSFQWLGKRRLALTAGTHLLRVVSDRPYFAFNSVRATAAPPPSPYFGTATVVPGSVEAAYFDNGGEGVGYHDKTTGNQGDAGFRPNESVDIFYSNDAASGSAYILKNFEAGEWLGYTVSVASGGSYDFEVHAATNIAFPNTAFHVEVDGLNATGTVVLPDTGGWSNYQWLGKRRLALTAGTHILKIVSEQPYFAFNSVRLTVPVATVPDPSKVLFSCGFATSPTDCGFSEQSKVPGRATLTNIARDGATGLRLHTEPGDNNVASSGEMERDDLWLSQAASDGYEGREAWWANSLYFPDDFTAPTWESYVVFDFHNSAPGPWQANFMVNFQRQTDTTQPGLLTITAYGGVNSGDGPYGATLGQIQRDVWYDFVYHVRWSSGSDGFFDAWLNGKRVLTHRGPTLYAGQGVYLKLANYHSPVCDPYPACIGTHKASSMIYDRIIRGTTPLAVSSGTLEGVLGLVNGVLTPLVP